MNTTLRVCSFESRRREEMDRLIRRGGGLPTIAPSMREIPLSENDVVFQFADQILAGEIDLIIFLTGVGTDALVAALEEQHRWSPVREALAEVTTVARGPKPAAALSRLKVHIDYRAPEPNTWHEITAELERNKVPLTDRTVAVQEYGQPSSELYQWLERQGANVLPVPVYKWGLPENLAPLRQAIQETIAGQFDVLLWTSAQQLNHVLEIATRDGCQAAWLKAANQCVIGSIGPTASERLQSLGLPADLEPSHPKMAHLVRETLTAAPQILEEKRN